MLVVAMWGTIAGKFLVNPSAPFFKVFGGRNSVLVVKE
jgi:hypothetical protein